MNECVQYRYRGGVRYGRDDCVYVRSLVAVEDGYELAFLCLSAAGICGFDAWPVEPSDGGEPNGSCLSEGGVARPEGRLVVCVGESVNQ